MASFFHNHILSFAFSFFSTVFPYILAQSHLYTLTYISLYYYFYYYIYTEFLSAGHLSSKCWYTMNALYSGNLFLVPVQLAEQHLYSCEDTENSIPDRWEKNLVIDEQYFE